MSYVLCNVVTNLSACPRSRQYAQSSCRSQLMLLELSPPGFPLKITLKFGNPEGSAIRPTADLGAHSDSLQLTFNLTLK